MLAFTTSNESGVDVARRWVSEIRGSDTARSYWGTDEETVAELILAGDTVTDAELFVLDQGWGEAVIRETSEFELESEGGFDVANSALFLPRSAHFPKSKVHRVGRTSTDQDRHTSMSRFSSTSWFELASSVIFSFRASPDTLSPSLNARRARLSTFVGQVAMASVQTGRFWWLFGCQRCYKEHGERDLPIVADLRGCGRSTNLAKIEPPNGGIRFSSIIKTTILLITDRQQRVSAAGEANVDIEAEVLFGTSSIT